MASLNPRVFFFSLVGGSLAVIALGSILLATMVRWGASAPRDVSIARRYTPAYLWPQPLAPGDYRLLSKGLMRRLVVFKAGPISYETWRATPNGKLQYLHYLLTPPTRRLVESRHYAVTKDGAMCGRMGLWLDRDANGANPGILILSYNHSQEPFTSSGLGLTARDFGMDENEVEKLRDAVAQPFFYRSLDDADRSPLIQETPKCTSVANLH